MAWQIEEVISHNPNQRDILVAIPHKGEVSFDFAAHLAMLQAPVDSTTGRALSMAISGNTGQPLDISRNIFAAKALQMGAQYVFYLDSDILVKPDTIQSLFEERIPIVSACYLNRGPPYELVANIKNQPVSHNIMKENPNKLYEVEEVGMGACLIDIRTFHRLAANIDKWRCIRVHNDELKPLTYSNNEAMQYNYACKECQGLLLCNFFDYTLGKSDDLLASEDYYFCRIVRQMGFSVYLKTSTFVVHETARWHLEEGGALNPISSAGLIQ